MKQITKCILLNLMVFGYMPVNASVIIDNFDDSAPYQVNAGTTSIEGTPNALGGSRTIEVVGPLGANAVVNGGSFFHNGAFGGTTTSTITWDNFGGGLEDQNGQPGIDLLATDNGMDIFSLTSTCFECFVLEIINIDQGVGSLTIGLEDTGAGASSFASVSATSGIFEVLFSSFTGVDLSAIDLISLTVVGTAASNLQLNLLGYTGSEAQTGTPVPVAPTAWLLLAGLVGFLSSRKNNAFEFM